VPILTAAVLTAINMIYAAWRLPEPAKHHHVVPEEMVKMKVLSHRPILKMCSVYFVFTLAVTQLEAIFAFFMMHRFNYDAMHVAYVLALMALIMIVIQGGLIRTLTQKYGENVLLIAGAIILGLAFIFIPKSGTVTLLLLPLGLASIGRGISQPSLMSLVSKKSPAHLRGTVMGTFQASASLGRVVGPLIAGVLYDHWQAAPFYFAAVMMAVVFIISATL
ncbi:MAG: MFS transporter, partial [Deltaproteobacteria bacterium]|nr:MFS transporter [Deltaproteobacteria bacterium]